MSNAILGVLIGIGISVAVDLISVIVIKRSPRLRRMIRERV